MTAILGISAFYHDSAAAIVVDGTVIAAAQEERFSRCKHDAGFPVRAVAYCLAEAGLAPHELDYLAFYDKPLLKFDRLIETYLAFAPRGFLSFAKAMPVWLKDKLNMRRLLRKALPDAGRVPIVFTDHHESHAASAFFPSPFDEAAILTLDGVGEWSTAAYGVGVGNRLRLTHHLQFPHSLGLLYSAFTYYCGFKVNSGEYKLMGLAPYGQPIYRDKIYEHLVDLKADGSLWLNMDYFNYCHGLSMTSPRFHELFGGPPRSPESRIEQHHMDLAASIQAVAEDAVLRMGGHVRAETGQKRLVMAGGVALNCVANGRLMREGPFDDIWVQPAAGDAGGSLGAALFVWHQLLEHPRAPAGRDRQRASLLGPCFSRDEIARFLAKVHAPHERFDDEAELLRRTAELLADGKIVGWFHGRMEFGPRALGARSILGDPRSPAMQANMNLKIKFRESFRPFAPVVLAEHAADWFEMRAGESPYMMLVAPVRKEHHVPIGVHDSRTMRQDPDLTARINVVRSTVPAVTHVDFSARVQTVDRARHPRFHRLLEAFHSLTGCPVLVNTSFNVRGEPIVCTPEEAYRCYRATGIDALVLEDFVSVKSPGAPEALAEEREQYLARFRPD